MNKIFKILIGITLAMGLASQANAQSEPISTFPWRESFDNPALPEGWTLVDADGDGHNWEFVGTRVSPHSGAGLMSSASYDNPTYSPLTPDNWLISPQIALPENSTFTFWMASQDESYPGEKYGVFVSTTGRETTDFTEVFVETMNATGGGPGNAAKNQTPWVKKTIDLSAYEGRNIYIAWRHFDCTDAFRLNLDDVKIMEGETIDVEFATMAFGEVLTNTDSIRPVAVGGYFLTEDITVSAPESSPFTVSADNTTFGQTATLSQNGGRLYVKYAPTAVGENTGEITLSSDGADDVTIALTGSAYNCDPITEFPWTENFENPLNSCWTFIDGDGDENQFSVFENTGLAHSTPNFLISFSKSGSTQYHPNNWIITPSMALGSGSPELSFYAAGTSDNYNEHFGIYITTGEADDTANYTLLEEHDTENDYVRYSIDLTTYAGQTVYIAFRHFNTPEGQNALRIDDIGIYDNGTIEATPTALDFGETEVNTNRVLRANVSGFALTEGITATAPEDSPFTVSADNITFDQTATLPQAGGTLYVKYAPTAEGENTGEITLSSEGADDVTIALIGSAIECSTITSFPWTESFDEGFLPACWALIDADNDGHNWEFVGAPTFTPNTGAGCVTSASYDNPTYSPLTPDNWLISPQIALPTNSTFTFWMASQDNQYPAEKYGVYVSTTGRDTADFTEIFVETMDVNGGGSGNAAKEATPWVQKTIDLSEYEGQNIYIAWRHFDSENIFMLNLDDVEITTSDAPVLFTVTVDPNIDGGTVTVRPENATTTGVAQNTEITLTVTPNPGYTISELYYVKEGETDHVAIVENKFDMPHANVTVYATFTNGDTPTPPALFTVTVDPNMDGGTVTVNTENATTTGVAQNTEITLTVTPNPDYTISELYYIKEGSEDQVAISENKFDMPDANVTVYATFTNGDTPTPPALFTVTVDPNMDGGTVTVETENATTTGVAESTEITLTVTPNPDYTISELYYIAEGNDTHVAIEGNTFNMPRANVTVYATFTHTTGIDADMLDAIGLYPNPVNDILNIEVPQGTTHVEILSVSGQLIDRINTNNTTLTYDVNKLDNANYLINIYTANSVITRKFVVKK